MTNVNIYESLAEEVVSDTPSLLVDSVLAETATTGSPSANVASVLLEPASTGSPTFMVAQVLLELIVSVPEYPMIPTIAFPDISAFPGLSWSIHRKPTSSTRISTATSGREVRTPLYTVPLYEFDLTYDVLNSGDANFQAVLAQTLQQIMGFFLQCQGQYASFLFTDPDFNQATGATLGTGNGSTTVFPLMRQISGYSEQVQAANVVSTIYFNGVAQASSGWAVVNGNQVQFSAAPAAGTVITADFTYYFVCRFIDDVHDYEEFMYQLHTLQSCKIRSVRTS